MVGSLLRAVEQSRVSPVSILPQCRKARPFMQPGANPDDQPLVKSLRSFCHRIRLRKQLPQRRSGRSAMLSSNDPKPGGQQPHQITAGGYGFGTLHHHQRYGCMYKYRPAETGRAAMLRETANKCETDATNTANTDVGGSSATKDGYLSNAGSSPRRRLTGRASKPVA